MKKLLFALLFLSSPLMALDYYIKVTNAEIGSNGISLRLTYEVRSYDTDRNVYVVMRENSNTENFVPLDTLSDDGVTPLTQQERINIMRDRFISLFDRELKFFYSREKDYPLLPGNLIGYEYPPAP